MTRHAPDVVAAAMKGHPDSLTALKILTEELEDWNRDAPARIQELKATWGRSAPRPRKFRRGTSIDSMADLLSWLDREGWVYMGNKPQHPSIIANMSLFTLRGFVARGGFARAIRNPVPGVDTELGCLIQKGCILTLSHSGPCEFECPF